MTMPRPTGSGIIGCLCERAEPPRSALRAESSATSYRKSGSPSISSTRAGFSGISRCEARVSSMRRQGSEIRSDIGERGFRGIAQRVAARLICWASVGARQPTPYVTPRICPTFPRREQPGVASTTCLARARLFGLIPSSHRTTGRGRGRHDGDDDVLYLRSDNGSTTTERGLGRHGPDRHQARRTSWTRRWRGT